MRGVLAAGAGVVAAGIGGLVAGAGAALAFFAGHAAYVWVRPGPMGDWRRGALAERATGRRLAALRPPDFRVLHDRALPGSATNVDHLVIGTSGVYSVASRRWRRGVRARRADEFGRAAASAVKMARSVSDALSDELDYAMDVVPVVAVHRGRMRRGGTRHGEVLFVGVRDLVREMSGRRAVLRPEQVTTVADAAERVFPVMGGR
ncbi:nuclease-related domain-containing protein [Actinomadura parmotrematis]|uniref:NERD domain-containing protein n=1 Tax=Actinomadura parmotrematis TaxID=2864039 RepID=A0ABS7G792_9ACTN|nr:nuclease-related domain-containing protein [Actinomadura parmotrematis]MBW8487734.1 NERD domain-containing protein [Actinomadura parmotrematis]